MKAIRDIEIQGYAVSREGEKIQVRRKEGFNPDATVVRVLLQEIREKAKPEEGRTRLQSLLRQKIWGFLTEEQRRKLTEMNQSSITEEKRPGRVWILSPEGKPVPVRITLGITNGTYSEVASGDLKEGMEVIVEETSGKKPSGTSSPFGRGLMR